MHAAMSFLIPIGVVFYAAIGGLKATFTTSYMHTVIVYGVCLFFLFKASNSPALKLFHFPDACGARKRR